MIENSGTTFQAVEPSNNQAAFLRNAAIRCGPYRMSARRMASVAMQEWNKIRPFSRMSALAFIGLAFCVFSWGLQSKLSLYDPPNAASHRIPMAKLLSRNEQFSPAESPIVIRTRTSTKIVYTASTAVFLMLFLIATILSGPLSGQREQRASRLWHLRRAHFRYCFVRPPPVLV